MTRKLVEPFKSAECYIFWNGTNSNTVRDGERVFYKWSKRGLFSWLWSTPRELLVWDEYDGWCRSANYTVPSACALHDEIIKIENSERRTVQEQTEFEYGLDTDDIDWEREQQRFIRRANAKSKARMLTSKRRRDDLH